MPRPLVIAHRGASYTHPENTLPAIAEAIALGVDIVELDVHESADGIAMLMHDRDLARTTGQAGTIDALGAAELMRLDAGIWRGPGHAGTGVPRLADAVAAIAGTGIALCLEFKDGEYRPAELAAAWLVGQFERFALHGRAVANLPAGRVAELVRRADPRIRVVLDCALPARDAGEAAEIAAALAASGGHGVEYEQRAVTAEAIRACQRLALPVWAWTANDRADWDRLCAAGIDAILTDDPGGLLRHLGRHPRAR